MDSPQIIQIKVTDLRDLNGLRAKLSRDDDDAFTVVNNQSSIFIDDIANQIHILIEIGQHSGQTRTAAEVIISYRECYGKPFFLYETTCFMVFRQIIQMLLTTILVRRINNDNESSHNAKENSHEEIEIHRKNGDEKNAP